MHHRPCLNAQHRLLCKDRTCLACILHVLSSLQPGKFCMITAIINTACICCAGVLPPCGHACNTVVLVDQGLRPLQHLPHVQLTHQATSKSTHVDCAPDPSPLQVQGQHSCTHGSGATEQSSHHIAPIPPPMCPHQQADSRMQRPSHQTQTCKDSPSSHVHSAQLGTPRTETAHLSAGVEAAQCTDTLYCGAGRVDAFLALSFDQLLALSNGQAVDLVQSGVSQSSSNGCSGPQQGRTLHTGNTFLLDSMCGRLCRWLRSAPIHSRMPNALQECAPDTYPGKLDMHLAKAQQ